jgi:hypothetical protein
MLAGCVTYLPAPAPVQPAPEAYPPQAPEAYPPQAEAAPAEAPPPQEPAAAVSVNVEPAVVEPAPIAVGWAPPPMLVEAPPPMPFMGAVWVGGYWVWQGNWVWAHGHWMGPPQPDYVWVHPYYEHRGDAVIFIDGHWSAPGVVFVPPPPGLSLVVETPAYGVIPGPRPIGPEGCFVPAPPGSRAGIIIPAPVGTAPAVVTSAPAVVNVGMHITNNATTVNNVTNVTNTNVTNTNVTNITRVTNVTNVTIVAPPAATASGRAYNTTVPAAPHLAAARPALVQARAPEPVNTRPLPVYTPGSRPPPLPHPPPVHAQPVNAGVAPARPGEAFSREPESQHAGPGSAVPPAAHPTPTAFGRDPGHGNPDSARSERAYPGGYEHQPAPQPQGDHKPPPPPQNANRPAQPQNGYHPAPQAQTDHRGAPPPQNEHRNAAPQPQPQGQHQGAPAHAEGDNHSHKTEAQSEHDAKHGQSNDH